MKKQKLRKMQEHYSNQVLERMVGSGKLKDVFTKDQKTKKK